MLRNLAVRLSRGVSLRRRLPRAFGGGRIFVSPESGGLRYWRFDMGKVDPALLRIVQEFVKPKACVWDIGSNVGLFCFAAANLAGAGGTVVAVEPDVDNVRLLLNTRRAMKTAANATVEILPIAVGAPGARLAQFQISSGARAANALSGFGLNKVDDVLETRRVPLLTMDELLDVFPPPSFVKIDVEGAELIVFSGAERLLTEVRPTLVVEVEQSNAVRVAEMLRARKYELYDADAPPESRHPTEAASWNTLAVPV